MLAMLLFFSCSSASLYAAPTAQPQRSIAPTYRVFATREGLVGHRTANGHLITPRDRFVALPSGSALASKDGYEFQVRLTYQGRSVVVPVWDVGPWNTRDDYWSASRRYGDLPVGLPMAQAAHFDGYHGGRDESGRRISIPNGIDIADGAFWDDLGMSVSDWVEVSFLWLGEDPGAGAAAEVAGSQPTQTPIEIAPNATAVDDLGAGYTANQSTWYREGCGVNGSHAWTYSTPDPARSGNSASWNPTLPNPGFYEVNVYIPACGKTPATAGAHYRITHDGATTEVVVDQAAVAGSWISLGTYHFGGEGAPRVDLNDVTVESKRSVRFDMITWTPRNDTTPPNAVITGIVRENNGYRVTWNGTDDLSGIASYSVQVRIAPNGGWTDWKLDTVDLSAWFGPDEGKQFEFRVRARDWAGNSEPWPAQADASTIQ